MFIFFLAVSRAQDQMEIDGEVITMPPPEMIGYGKKNPFMDKMKEIIKSKDEEKIKKMLLNFVKIEDPIPLRAEDEIESKVPEDCGVPNTVRLDDGKCICKKGYISDDSIMTRGCWSCDHCSSNASCEFPGECKCQHGLVGDGNTCYAPKPIVYNATINREIIHAAFETPKEYHISEAYCRYGIYEAQGSIINSNTIECICSIETKPSTITISFDRYQWSNPVVLIDVSPNFPWKKISLIFMFIVVALGVFAYIGSTRRMETKSDSLTPFLAKDPKNTYQGTRRRDI